MSSNCYRIPADLTWSYAIVPTDTFNSSMSWISTHAKKENKSQCGNISRELVIDSDDEK